MPRSLDDKIQAIGSLKKIIFRLKAAHKKIVFTNGCFDLLHYGHVKYLQDAKEKGDILVVGVNSDASVKRIKGSKRPVIKERDRARVLAGLESIDYIVVFNQDTPLEVIKAVKPDVLVKGADWSADKIVGGDLVSSCGGRVTTIKFLKGYSTSGIIKKIVKKA
jgi:rfaE bifunctional protein nucleotidyltransferase chain/domain